MVLKLHIAKPLEHLRNMLAESEEMQALLGVDSEEAAAELILYGYAEDGQFSDLSGAKGEKLLPRVMVALEDCESRKETTDSWSTIVGMSIMIQTLRLTADKNKSLSERYKSFLNRIEGVVDSLRELAADSTRLNLLTVTTDLVPQRADLTETDGVEIWQCVLLVTAGG